MKRNELIRYIAQIIMVHGAWNDYKNETNQDYWETVTSELLTAMEKHPEIVVGVRKLKNPYNGSSFDDFLENEEIKIKTANKVKPAELTKEEIADLIANDTDLQEDK